MLLSLLLTAPISHADDDTDGMELVCSYACNGDGFTIEVLADTAPDIFEVRLVPHEAVWYTDFDSAEDDAELIATQTTNDGYCSPDGLYIYGDVYENVDFSIEWSSATTGVLNGTDPCTQGGDLNYALSLLATYDSSAYLPDFCSDIGCPQEDAESSDGEDHTDGDSGAGTFTDASNTEREFPDLHDESTEGSGGGTGKDIPDEESALEGSGNRDSADQRVR